MRPSTSSSPSSSSISVRNTMRDSLRKRTVMFTWSIVHVMTMLLLFSMTKMTTAIMPPHPSTTRINKEGDHLMMPKLCRISGSDDEGNINKNEYSKHDNKQHNDNDNDNNDYDDDDTESSKTNLQCQKELNHDYFKVINTDDNDDERVLSSYQRRGLESRIGKTKVLVILIEFDNHSDRPLIEPLDIETLFVGGGKDANIIPTGSIRSYFRINSYHQMDIETFVVPWFTLVNITEQDCLFDNYGLDREFQNRCLRPVLEALDELHRTPDHDFTWNDYDMNLDGFLDSVVVMHSGYGAEWGEVDPSGNNATQRIWSHSIVQPQRQRWSSKYYSISLGPYCITSSFHGHEGTQIAPIGIVIHEMLHTFGLPDLFDLSRSDQWGGTGSYSIMSNAWGQANDATNPGNLDPWSKIQLGWVVPNRIVSNGTYLMRPSAEYGDIYVIDDPYPEGEYLLIENRQPLHYDRNLWTGGTLIWHIDEKVESSFNSKPGGPYQVGWPENGRHYQVALLQADGDYDLEQGFNRGDIGDFFLPGTALGPGSGAEGEEGDSTAAEVIYPNTDSYQSGIIQNTNIVITDFEKNGFHVNFTIAGLPPVDPSSSLSNSMAPSHAPMEKRSVDPSKCLININTHFCSDHIRHYDIQPPSAGCDCYNFCGTGGLGQYSCCRYGEACWINCHSGTLIAGCTHRDHNNNDDNPDILVPGSSLEQDGIIVGTEGEGTAGTATIGDGIGDILVEVDDTSRTGETNLRSDGCRQTSSRTGTAYFMMTTMMTFSSIFVLTI